MGYRVAVDFDLCESNAVCVATAPALFELEDGGTLVIVDPVPPDSLRPLVEEAVQRCPRQALSLRPA